MGPLQTQIYAKLTGFFDPVHFELENESHSHSVPKNSETHFRAVIVSDKFQGLSRLARQRLAMEQIDYELKNGVHALTLRCLTSEEWQSGQAAGFVSPVCHGGSKSE